MSKWIITAPRYVKQLGDSEPRYVRASPGLPATIEMPDTYKPWVEDHTIRPAETPAPALKPAHASKQAAKIPSASEASKVAPKTDGGVKTGRASDQ